MRRLNILLGVAIAVGSVIWFFGLLAFVMPTLFAVGGSRQTEKAIYAGYALVGILVLGSILHRVNRLLKVSRSPNILDFLVHVPLLLCHLACALLLWEKFGLDGVPSRRGLPPELSMLTFPFVLKLYVIGLLTALIGNAYRSSSEDEAPNKSLERSDDA